MSTEPLPAWTYRTTAVPLTEFPTGYFPIRVEMRNADRPTAEPWWSAIADGPCHILIPHAPPDMRVLATLTTRDGNTLRLSDPDDGL